MNVTQTKPDHHAPRYSVTVRACSPNEPNWVVYIEGSGKPADSMAHFFTQEGANAYCDWMNRKPKRNEV